MVVPTSGGELVLTFGLATADFLADDALLELEDPGLVGGEVDTDFLTAFLVAFFSELSVFLMIGFELILFGVSAFSLFGVTIEAD